MIIFILVLIGLWILYPLIARTVGPYIKRWLMRQAVKQFARRAGFDTSSAKGSAGNTGNKESGRRRKTKSRPSDNGPIIPREYAEDVEFTEIRSYSEEREIGEDRIVSSVEEQVSDAEIIEITKNGSDGKKR